MFCPKCGSMLDEGAAVCSICGAPVTRVHAQETFSPSGQAGATFADQGGISSGPMPEMAGQPSPNSQPMTFMPPIYRSAGDDAAWSRPVKETDRSFLPLVFLMVFLILLIVAGVLFGYAVYTGRILSTS